MLVTRGEPYLGYKIARRVIYNRIRGMKNLEARWSRNQSFVSPSSENFASRIVKIVKIGRIIDVIFRFFVFSQSSALCLMIGRRFNIFYIRIFDKLFGAAIICVEVRVHVSKFYDTISLSFLPLGSNYPVVPTELRKVHVESLLAALTLYSTAALDRSSPNPFHSRRIRADD